MVTIFSHTLDQCIRFGYLLVPTKLVWADKLLDIGKAKVFERWAKGLRVRGCMNAWNHGATDAHTTHFSAESWIIHWILGSKTSQFGWLPRLIFTSAAVEKIEDITDKPLNKGLLVLPLQTFSLRNITFQFDRRWLRGINEWRILLRLLNTSTQHVEISLLC